MKAVNRYLLKSGIPFDGGLEVLTELLHADFLYFLTPLHHGRQSAKVFGGLIDHLVRAHLGQVAENTSENQKTSFPFVEGP